MYMRQMRHLARIVLGEEEERGGEVEAFDNKKFGKNGRTTNTIALKISLFDTALVMTNT